MGTSPIGSRGRTLALIEVIAGACLVVAAAVLPWATYRDVLANTTTEFRAGVLGATLVGVGVLSIGVGVLGALRESKWLRALQIVVASAALLVSIVLALRKISSANHVVAEGMSQTSYALGAVVGVIASLALVIASVLAFTTAERLEQLR
jgi:hypothetical protein